jgi:hypothetical protein
MQLRMRAKQKRFLGSKSWPCRGRTTRYMIEGGGGMAFRLKCTALREEGLDSGTRPPAWTKDVK